MTDDERQAILDTVAAEVRVCTKCRLHAGRTLAVPGEGSAATEVIFVGEGPGAHEDQQGRPFVGAAGGLLTELLGSIGWLRNEVFITNVVKCRPPGNRDPEADEIAACAPYLHRQLEALDPALVITLGRFSLQTFMPGARISTAHGTVRPVESDTGAADALALALYHPAAAFRQAGLRETLFEDMSRVPDVLIRSREGRAARRSEAVTAVEPDRVPAITETETLPASIEAELEPVFEPESEAALEAQAIAIGAPNENGVDDANQLRFF